MSQHNRLVVFTGGPGAGKTSVISSLQQLGYSCMPETGREIIREQVANDGSALPWDDKQAFRDQMLAREVSNFEFAQGKGKIVFFDRGLADVLGYSTLASIPVPEQLVDDCQTYRYSPQVFVFPPWAEIYTKDAERKQDFALARRTHDEMVETYQRLGYTLVQVPKATIAERVQFVLRQLRSD